MGVEVMASDNTKLEEERTQNAETNVTQGFSGFEAAEAPNGAEGSLNVQDKNMQPGVVDMDVPKDVQEEWPEPKEIQTFYMVKYRSYEDPQLKQKLEQAKNDYHKKNQARFQILESLSSKRSQKAEVIQKLKPLTIEEKVFRKSVDAKRKEMEPLQTALGKFRSANTATRERGQGLCSSIEELERRIKALNFKIEHENNTMEEDKQLIKELERLKKSRGQIMAIEANNTKLQETMGDKEVIQDSFRLLGGELDAMKKEHQAMWNSIKPLEVELRGIEDEIKALEEELAVATEKRIAASQTSDQLRRELNDGNNPYFQYRNVLDALRKLSSKRDREEFSHDEVEKFMSIWNNNNTFREDYIKRCSPFLVNRQLSKDGRMRNPDEEPPVSTGVVGLGSNFVKDNIKRENGVTKAGNNLINSVVTDLNGAPKENEKHVTGSAKSNVSPKASKAILHETDSEADEVDKDKSPIKHETDLMLLKEKRRVEEIAKARQALERKKKAAEKTQAKAAAKAQKDAEKKLKERAKKARKKAVVAAGAQGSVPEAAPTTEDDAANTDAQPEQKITEDKQPDKVSQANEKLRHRNRDFTMKSKGKPGKSSFPKFALKKKQSFPSWLWAGAVILLTLVLLVIGYYYVL